eukprot:GSChrysophyteH2.ASY1.ANO1.1739.1 assembled CDS
MLDWIQHLVDDDVDETSVLLGDSGDSPRRADARDSGSTPSKPGEAGGSANKKKGIGVVSLAVLTYYSVSGGPFGFENVVRAGGPFWALMGFGLFFVGSVAWVEAAFGPRWAFMKGWLYVLIAFITLSLTYLNYRGLDVVGKVAIFICVFSLAPFVAFCVIGSFNIDPKRWSEGPAGGIEAVNWRLLLNTFYWNINFWDSAASFSGDVHEPVKSFPPGIVMALILVFLSTFLPILIGTAASTRPYTEWTDGYFVALGVEIAGPWLGYWMMAASSMTNIGMFEAEMSSDAWQVCGMAERGIIPKRFSDRNAYGTPKYGVLVSLVGVLAVTTLEFEKVIDLLNLLFCFGQTIEYIAFMHLRYAYPTMNRPWKIPLGKVGISVMLFLPLAFSFAIFLLSSSQAVIISTSLSVLGLIVYELMQKARQHNWCEFCDYEPYSHGIQLTSVPLAT